jgi:hypothetical protein
MNRHEHSAWWRFALGGAVFGYLFWKLFFSDSIAPVGEWGGLHDALNVVLVIALVVGEYLRKRGGIAQDERDRAISGLAAQNALAALCIVVLTTPMIIRNDTSTTEHAIVREFDWLLFYGVACVAFAIWVEAAVTVFHHWRDRR